MQNAIKTLPNSGTGIMGPGLLSPVIFSRDVESIQKLSDPASTRVM